MKKKKVEYKTERQREWKKPRKFESNYGEAEPKIPFREKLKDKNFRTFLILFVVATVFGVASTQFEGYLKQASVILGLFLYYFALRALRKYDVSRGKHYVRDFFRGLGRYIRRAYEIIKAKAFEILGIKPRSAFMRGKDEKDIVVDHTPGAFDKIFSFLGRPKWRDMRTNSQKVRFIYTKFMVRISKKGYRMLASHTPNEIEKLAPRFVKVSPDDISPLFFAYEAARYTDSAPISDDTVEKIKRI